MLKSAVKAVWEFTLAAWRKKAEGPKRSRTARLLPVIEAILVAGLWIVYTLGGHQLMQGPWGNIWAAALATLLILLLLVFVENAFCGKTRATRSVARAGMVVFMLFAALMTGSLLYVAFFGVENADRQAFDAVRQLEAYSQGLAQQYSTASSRYAAVSALSEQRSVAESTSGNTCSDPTKGIAGVRSHWREEFARETKADSDEIAARAQTAKGLAAEIQTFGQTFDPHDPAAMQARWADLTGRLQAAGGDARIPQLVTELQNRLNAADRNIGVETRAGKPHVVTCSDPDLRNLSEGAASALQAIKAPPTLTTAIVGADLQSAVHRMVAMVLVPLGRSSEIVAPEEYIIFGLATILEMLFLGTKWFAYAGDARDLPRDRPTATDTLRPALDKVSAIWKGDNARHEFLLLRQFVVERNPAYVRLAVRYSAPNAQQAIASLEVLVADGLATFIDEKAANDIDDSLWEVIGRPRGKSDRVAIFHIPSTTWNGFIAASTSP